MARTLIVPLLLAACIFTVSSHAQDTPASPPDTPAGHTLSDWLEAMNSADQAKIQHYVDHIDKHQHVDGMLSFAHQTGGFTLVSIERSEPNLITFRVHEKAGSTIAFGTLKVAPGNPPTVDVFNLRAIPPGSEFDDPPLDAAERSRVIEAVTSNLTKLYVYPEVAAKMNTYVQARAQHGD